jgi:hypothetical protein
MARLESLKGTGNSRSYCERYAVVAAVSCLSRPPEPVLLPISSPHELSNFSSALEERLLRNIIMGRDRAAGRSRPGRNRKRASALELSSCSCFCYDQAFQRGMRVRLRFRVVAAGIPVQRCRCLLYSAGLIRRDVRQIVFLGCAVVM